MTDLSEMLVSGQIGEGSSVSIDAANDKGLKFEVATKVSDSRRNNPTPQWLRDSVAFFGMTAWDFWIFLCYGGRVSRSSVACVYYVRDSTGRPRSL